MCNIVELPDGRSLNSIGDLFVEWPGLSAEVVFLDGPGMVSLGDAVRSGFGNTCLCLVDTTTVLNKTTDAWEEIDYGYKVL